MDYAKAVSYFYRNAPSNRLAKDMSSYKRLSMTWYGDSDPPTEQELIDIEAQSQAWWNDSFKSPSESPKNQLEKFILNQGYTSLQFNLLLNEKGNVRAKGRPLGSKAQAVEQWVLDQYEKASNGETDFSEPPYTADEVFLELKTIAVGP